MRSSRIRQRFAGRNGSGNGHRPGTVIGEHIQEADANPGWGLACCPQPDACTNCHAPYLVSRIEQTVVAEDPGRASLIDKEERSMAEDSLASPRQSWPLLPLLSHLSR